MNKPNLKKDGKQLEKVVEIFQKALSGRSNTKIHKNYKMRDSIGGIREIDVLISSEINGFAIMVAIECKDYNRPITIDKIDAFKSKCDSLPQINKMVFVAKSGYSSGAKRNAERYGIALYEVSELNHDSISEIFPKISLLSLQYQIVNIKYGFGTNNEELIGSEIKVKPQLFRNNELVHDDIRLFVQREISSNIQIIQNHAIIQFTRNSELMLNEGMIQKSTIKFSEGFSLMESVSEIHIPLSELQIDINLKLIESNPEIVQSNSFGKMGENETLHQMSVGMGNGMKAELVRINQDDYKMYIDNSSGDITELTTLALYDPEKDTFTDLLDE